MTSPPETAGIASVDDAPSAPAGGRGTVGNGRRARRGAIAATLLALALVGCATGAGAPRRGAGDAAAPEPAAGETASADPALPQGVLLDPAALLEPRASENGHGVGAQLHVALDAAVLDDAVANAAAELGRELAAGGGDAAGRRLAVMPPRAASPELGELADDLRHRLGDHLRATVPELVLVERDDLEALWSEHRLSATGLLDPRAVLELGRVLSAGALLLGSLVEVAGVPQLHLRLVDVETAELLASASRPLASGARGSAEPPGADPGAPGRAAALPPPDLQVVSDFRFALESCGFVATKLVCRITVANLAPGARALTFLGETKLHDTHGVDYRLQRVRVGTAVADLPTRTARARHVFPGNLQVSVELTFSGVSRRKRKVQLLDVQLAEGRWAVTDIPLGRD